MACSIRENIEDQLRSEGIIGKDNFFIYKMPQAKKFVDKINSELRANYALIGEPLSISGQQIVFDESFFERAQQLDDMAEAQYEYLDEELEYEYETENTYTINPVFQKYADYQISRLRNYQQRIKELKQAKKNNKGNYKAVKALDTKIKELEKVLNGTQSEIGLIERVNRLTEKPKIEEINYGIIQDIARLNEIIHSNRAPDLREAKAIIDYYKAAGTFDAKDTTHPLFEVNEMFDEEGNLRIPEELRENLEIAKERVTAKGWIYDNKVKSIIVDTINSNAKIKATFGEDREFTYEELFYTKNGLADASIADMIIMDITNGIASHNGVVPQVIMSEIQDNYAKALSDDLNFQRKIKELTPKVEKALRKMGYGMLHPRIGGVSFDLFIAKSKNGKYKDRFVTRYSYEYNSMWDSAHTKAKVEMEAVDSSIAYKDPILYERKVSGILRKLHNWKMENTHLIDYGALPELNLDTSLTDAEKTTLRKEYIEILGQRGYDKVVQEAKEKMASYEVELKLFKDSLMDEFGVTESELSTDPKMAAMIHEFVVAKSPVEYAKHYRENKIGSNGLFTSDNFAIHIPRKEAVDFKYDRRTGGTSVTPNGKSTGYYDENFKIIESNNDLREFHELFVQLNTKMQEVLPAHILNQIGKGTLLTIDQGFTESLFNSKTTPGLVKRLSKSAARMYSNIAHSLGERNENQFSQANTDPVTGRPQYEVSTKFIRSISSEVSIELNTAAKFIGKVVLGRTNAISSNEKINLTEMSQSQIEDIAFYLKTPASLSAIEKRFPDTDLTKFPLKFKIREAMEHHKVQNSSMDLSKVLSYYGRMLSEYEARNNTLPLAELLKEHYEGIKAPEKTDKQGKSIINTRRNKKGAVVSQQTRLTKERVHAKKQMNSFFDRVILGDYSSKNEFGETRAIKRTSGRSAGRIKRLEELVDFDFNERDREILSSSGKIFTTQDKRERKRLFKLLEKELASNPETMSLSAEKTLEAIDRIGVYRSAASSMDNVFKYIRYKFLGWNGNSGITNYAEGQIANLIIAAQGEYFEPDLIYRAQEMLNVSTAIKNSSLGFIRNGNNKLIKYLMESQNILQDSANELQKTTTGSRFSKRARLLHPFELTRRIEYMNQAPLMIAMLLDIKITGKNGEVSSVFEAYEKGDNAVLKEEFRTEENIENWENFKGEKYLLYRNKLGKAIVNAHGDYDTLRGMMGSEYMTGKVFLMFKRWMARQVYRRLSWVEQSDIESGIDDHIGRYHSNNTASGAISMGMLGGAGLSILGFGALGTVSGLLLGGYLGRNYSRSGDHSPTIQQTVGDLVFFSKEILLNLGRIPLNSLSAVAKKGPIIKTNNYKRFKERGYKERDIRNLRANMMELSMLLAFQAMIYATKVALASMGEGGSDEEKRKREKAEMYHNLVVNKLNQLSAQTALYSRPDLILDNYLNGAALSVMLEIDKANNEYSKYINGQSVSDRKAMEKYSKLLLPPSFRDFPLGMEKQMEKQFRPTIFDEVAKGSEKKAKEKIRQVRAEFREMTEKKHPTWDKKKIEKEVERQFPSKRRSTKKRKYSYEDHWDKYQDNLDALE